MGAEIATGIASVIASAPHRGARFAVRIENYSSHSDVATVSAPILSGVSATMTGHKYVTNSARMATMDASDDDDEHDELIDDAAMPDETTDDVPAYRERATGLLQDIAQQTKQALADAGINLHIFFTIPSSGHSIITFGTVADPDDETWTTVSEIVSAVVKRTIGVERTRCRSLLCATTHPNPISLSPDDRSPVQPSESSGCCSMPMLAPTLQHTGAEQ